MYIANVFWLLALRCGERALLRRRLFVWIKASMLNLDSPNQPQNRLCYLQTNLKQLRHGLESPSLLLSSFLGLPSSDSEEGGEGRAGQGRQGRAGRAGCGQRAEGRGQRAEGRGQRAEGRRAGGQEGRGQRAGQHTEGRAGQGRASQGKLTEIGSR